MSRAGSSDGGAESATQGCVRQPGMGDIRNFAHAVRNPLNGARLHLVYVERELAKLGAAPDTLQAARVIDEEIGRIAELVSELVEARSSARSRSRVSLRSLCARALELVSGDAREAGVSLGTELEDPDVMLEVQRDEVVQVLFDLLHRALQGALAGSGRVLLRARRDTSSGRAVIEIQHDGSCSGLGPALSEGRGADFNLAVRVVADHGGSIDVISRPGRASFHVALPISGEPRADDQRKWG